MIENQTPFPAKEVQFFGICLGNKANKSIMKIKPLLIALLIIFSLFSACDKDKKPPKPPIVLPFAVHKAGSKVVTELRIVEDKPYLFELRFMFRNYDETDRARVRKLAGSADVDKDGKLLEPGIPIPLRLTISLLESTDERIIFNKEISEQRLRAWSADHFSKNIATITLKSNRYRVVVEGLKDIPQLKETTIKFVITPKFYGK